MNDIDIVDRLEHDLGIKLLQFTDKNSKLGRYKENGYLLDKNGKVKVLVLKGVGITELPKYFLYLHYLEHLDLSSNRLSDLMNTSNLTDLKVLHLYDNRISTLPESLSYLSNLQELNLTYNQLSTLPESIANLNNLSKLDLYSNRFTTFPEAITNLRGLKRLDLGDNQLSTLPEIIGKLNSLQVLNLWNNQISSLPELIYKLVNLQELDLRSNNISCLSEIIGTLQSLKNLNLSHNKLNDLPEAIGNLRGLQNLNLSNNRLITLAESIGNLSNLEYLYLHRNRLTNLPLTIGNLTVLQAWDLHQNRLTTLPETICNLSGLIDFDLSYNQLSILPECLFNLNMDIIMYEDSLLNGIKLYSNPLKIPPTKTATQGRDAILNYFKKQRDLKIIKQLENELGVKLPKLVDTDKDEWKNYKKNGYVVNKMKRVEALVLMECNLTTLPAGVENLDALQYLALNQNRLTRLPKSIAKLKGLRKLLLNGNQLSTLPKIIGKLTALEELYLFSNQLTELPESIGRLTNLRILSLSSNKLVTIPESIGKLRGLTKLSLRYNKLTSLPESLFNLEMAVWWENGYSDSGINLFNNPLSYPPIEIIKQGREAVLNYYSQLKEKGTIELYEAKMLVVGEPFVGKSCLLKRLTEPEYVFDENEKSTEGIDIRRWGVEESSGKGGFTLHCWDFGGQAIYHATHQFFLTKRSLYLFVWDARRDSDIKDFDYWLNVIKLLSDSSPVLVILNKIDERTKVIDETSLKEAFPNISTFHKVSVKNGIGINDLKKLIINEFGKLPHIGDSLPGVWLSIRDVLERLDKNYISYSEYLELCRDYGQDEEQARYLSRYFHDLGVFLHFEDNIVLKYTLFLKPDWAVDAVYALVDSKKIIDRLGRFTLEDVEEVWQNYPYEQHQAFLELMKKFELCFELPGKGEYIIAELLSESPLKESWSYKGNLRFEYRYNFMPDGIITRFIVRCNDIIDDEFYWKYGVILKRGNSRALVVSKPLERKIELFLSGDERRELLAIIRREIEHIHNTLSNPDVYEMVPCICKDCLNSDSSHFFRYDRIQKAREKKVLTLQCGISFTDVPIVKLLGGIELVNEEGEKMNQPLFALKEFVVRRFSDDSSFDKLCRLMNINTSFNGNFSGRVHELIDYIELNLGDAGFIRLKKQIGKLLPKYNDEIDIIFQQLNLKTDIETNRYCAPAPFNILHLSDLHFTSSTNPDELLFPLIQDIETNLGCKNIDFLVISGDISNHATIEEFERAYRFIETLCSKLDILPHNCIITPGNHDLSWEVDVYDFKPKRVVKREDLAKGSYVEEGNIIGIKRSEQYPKRFNNFNTHFYKKFYKEGYPIALDEQAIPLIFPEQKLQFLTLNSACYIDEWYSNRSGIHSTALSKGLDKAAKQIKEAGLSKDELLRIAVIHHPVTGNEKIIKDAFIELLRNDGFKIIMHGHVHEERADLLSYINPRSVHAIGTGSFGTPVCKLAPATPRLYYLLEVSGQPGKVKINTRSRRNDNGSWDGWAVWPGDEPGTKKCYYEIEV